MKIIITGATGFIGRNLAERFHDDGHEVVATGRSADVGKNLKKQGILFEQADLLDNYQLYKFFPKADCVIHCAGKIGPWGKYKDFYKTNVVGTRNVISACKKYQIKKIIFISTPSVYFSNKDRFNITEEEPLPVKQLTNYSKTKLIAENELTELQKQGYKIIIFRPRAVYGQYDNSIIPRILKLADKKQFPLINNGNALTDITYIDNFVDAVTKSLIASEEAWNQVYNISNDDPISLKTWFNQVLKIFDRPFNPKNIPEPVAKFIAGINEFVCHLPFINKEPSLTRFSVKYMAKSTTMDIKKARQLLNYTPQISNTEGFELYAEWLKQEIKKSY